MARVGRRGGDYSKGNVELSQNGCSSSTHGDRIFWKRNRDIHHRTVTKTPVKNLIMEEVVILKRGEDLKSKQATASKGFRSSLHDVSSDYQPGKDRGEVTAEDTCRSLNRASRKNGRTRALGDISTRDLSVSDPEKVSVPYADSLFLRSPSPGSLPLPSSSFLKKKVAATTDLATQALRYMLRLDLP
ncbi:uncharacterized protein LOC144709893 [Wolffia australiana]